MKKPSSFYFKQAFAGMLLSEVERLPYKEWPVWVLAAFQAASKPYKDSEMLRSFINQLPSKKD